MRLQSAVRRRSACAICRRSALRRSKCRASLEAPCVAQSAVRCSERHASLEAPCVAWSACVSGAPVSLERLRLWSACISGAFASLERLRHYCACNLNLWVFLFIGMQTMWVNRPFCGCAWRHRWRISKIDCSNLGSGHLWRYGIGSRPSSNCACAWLSFAQRLVSCDRRTFNYISKKNSLALIKLR